MARGGKEQDDKFTVFTSCIEVFWPGAMLLSIALLAALGIMDFSSDALPAAYAQPPTTYSKAKD